MLDGIEGLGAAPAAPPAGTPFELVLYVLASPNVLPHLKAAFIHRDVKGSDHCPVGVHLDPAVTAR